MIHVRYDRSAHLITVQHHTEANGASGQHHAEANGAIGSATVQTAASTLTYTLAAALIDLCAAGQITAPDARLRPGDAYLHCHSSHASRGAVLLTFDTVARGFALLASRYPDEMAYEEI